MYFVFIGMDKPTEKLGVQLEFELYQPLEDMIRGTSPEKIYVVCRKGDCPHRSPFGAQVESVPEYDSEEAIGGK
jgi:hypothetical protein